MAKLKTTIIMERTFDLSPETYPDYVSSVEEMVDYENEILKEDPHDFIEFCEPEVTHARCESIEDSTIANDLAQYINEMTSYGSLVSSALTEKICEKYKLVKKG